jgi:hypothetical protein
MHGAATNVIAVTTTDQTQKKQPNFVGQVAALAAGDMNDKNSLRFQSRTGQFETTGHHIVADRYTDIRQRGNLKYLYAKRLGS